ncbi:MAG: hypothetical protein U1E39_08835 [Planctomycetota bacterium]
MPTPTELLWLIVLPAAAVLVVRFAASRVGTRGPVAGSVSGASGAADALLAVGIVAGFGLAAWFGEPALRPSLPLAPSDSSFLWVVWFAPAGLVLGLLDGRLPVVARWGLRLAVGAGAAWLILEPVAARLTELEIALRVGASAVLSAALWAALADPRDPGRRHATAVATIVALAAGGLVYVHVGHVARMGQTAAILSAVVGAAAAPVPPTRPFHLPRVVAGALALVIVPLSLSGFVYLNSESPWHTEILWPVATAVLVPAAPLAGLLVPPRWPRLVTAALAALLALAVVAGGAIAGGILTPTPAQNQYGY